MKTKNLLFVTTLIFSNTVLSTEVKNFGRGYVDFVETTNYSFEMVVTNQSKSSIRLESDKVTKQTTLKFSPTYDEPDAPYDKFEYERAVPAYEDDTVSLKLDLGGFEQFNVSRWFKKTNVELKETFSPATNVIDAIENRAKASKITDQELIDDTIKDHLYLASEYTHLNPRSNRHVESKVFDKVITTNVTNNDVNLSQDVRINFQNFKVFAGEMSRDRTNAKYLDEFFLDKPYIFVEELIQAASKQKDITYTYFLYNLTSVLPLEMFRELDHYNSGYKVSLAENKDGSIGLNCVKKLKERFTCQITYTLTTKVTFPNSKELSEHSFPKFVIDTLSRSGMTNEKFQEESDSIDIDSIRLSY